MASRCLLGVNFWRYSNEEENDMKTKTDKLSMFVFWLHFGRLFGAFWEPKSVQKSSEILDAFLEAKKEFR